MYAHEIGRIDAEPSIAPATGPTLSSPDPAGSPGRYGARCARAATGPTPGPPPPWGIQNGLCRLRCEPSPPNSPGLAMPRSALRLAPSTYTWPPPSWMILEISSMPCSYTPCVDG